MAFKHDYCSLYEDFGGDEIEVAEILLDFPRLIAVSKYGSLLPFSWGGTRRRSAEANLGPRCAVHSPPTSASPSQTPILSVPVGPATPPPPPPAAAAAVATEPEGPITVKAEPATSPATPLSFSPSESDERPKRLKRKVYTKKRREDLLKITSQIIDSNELLRAEIQKVTRYYEHLKARNSLLKARKQELNMGVIKREDQLNLPRMNSVQSTVKCPPVVDDQNQFPRPMPGIRVQQPPPPPRPYMADRNANNQEMGCNHPNPYGQRVSLLRSISASDGMGPRDIPDLNLTVGEPVWMDSKQLFVNDRSAAVKRAIAAQARQRRRLICKDKSFNSSSKSRFSFR
ncbi:PREDICTED: uncharacterized protein LOC105140094 [Populus euphratica]|uniref:Uncharacterized protein LOC105140094 n=1 Tax=Populus euphratica TaxID=75702 RepID=A0AAJ6VC08_POPEU|nr:PREDICTED: uncharacterized protein LOC105140094 [Populus euphratica]